MVPWSPAINLDRRQRAVRARRKIQRKFVETCLCSDEGEREKRARYRAAVSALVFETRGRLGGDGTKLLRDLVTTAAANGQCSPFAVGRWRVQVERVLVTAGFPSSHVKPHDSQVKIRPEREKKEAWHPSVTVVGYTIEDNEVHIVRRGRAGRTLPEGSRLLGCTLVGHLKFDVMNCWCCVRSRLYGGVV